MNLPKLQTVQRLAGMLGVPGFIGLALCLTAALAWGVWLPQAQAELDQQQEQIELLRSQLKAATAAQARATDPAGRQDRKAVDAVEADQADGPDEAAAQARAAWQHLWAALPDKAQADRTQVALLDAARMRGMQTSSVQFKGEVLKGLPVVWRQQINLPVEAPYPALRAWLAYLQAQPALSIDAIDVGRSEVMSDVVKARVQVSLWRRSTQREQEPQP